MAQNESNDLKGRPVPAPPGEGIATAQGGRAPCPHCNANAWKYDNVEGYFCAACGFAAPEELKVMRQSIDYAAEQIERIGDHLHDTLQAFDEDGRERNINVVDAGFAIARAIDRLADAVENMSSAKATKPETPKSWSASHRRSADTARGSGNELKAKRELESRFGA